MFAGQGAFLVGAPEFILAQRYEEYRDTVDGWAEQGCRVLLAARYDGDPVPGALDPALVAPLALILLSGRLREQAAETFGYFDRQGVTVKVISGDNPHTASLIAARAGIPGADRYIDTSALETDEDFSHAVSENTVFGRVTPEKKRRLVAALQKQGHTVAMTGDGVNDLLAMKQADCSIAFSSGAQAASQLGSLVLLNNDFAAMPGIVAEGRRVINNIQRAATLCLGKNIFSLKDEALTIFRRRKIGFVFQSFNLVPVLTVRENIVLPIQLDGGKVDERYVGEVVTALGLEKKLNSLPGQLSGGQQQRVAIARALATKPAILLADEPTGNLDSRTSQDVLSLMKVTGRKFSQTMVMITHNEEIAQLSDRIVRIEDGRIVTQ